MSTKAGQTALAEDARRAAEKARRLGNEGTAKMFDRIAAAHAAQAEKASR